MLPRLLMPNSFCLPPVEYCRGTTPTHAAKSRPRRNAAPLPIAAGGGDQRSKAGDPTQTLTALIFVTDALDFVRDGLDVDLGLLPLLPQPIQEPAQTWAQVLLGIFHHCAQVLAQVNGLCREGDAALQQEAADLIDQRGTALHQSIPNSVHGLHIELLLGLDLHEAHVLFGYRFGNRFPINEVILVRLSIRLYEL